MKTSYILSALLAAGLATAAHAATVSSAAPDLVLGFQESGASNDYEVNLGSMVTFYNAAPGAQINLSNDLSSADLTSLFGSGWANEAASSNAAVTWGAAATVGATANSQIAAGAKATWVTQADGTILSAVPTNLYGQGSAPASQYSQISGSTLNTREGDINSYVNLLNNKTGSANPVNKNTATTTILASSSSSFSQWDGNASNTFSPAVDSNTGLAISSGQFAVIDLFTYENGSGSGSYLGSLELGTDGTLWFTAAAVPEPSTYAAILGVACLGIAAIRRRKQQILA